MSLVSLKPKYCKQIPGVEIEVLLATTEDITNDPLTVAQVGYGPPAVGNYAFKQGDGLTYAQPFQYRQNAAGETVGKWYRAVIVTDSGKITSKTVGERGFKSHEHGFKGMLKGFDVATREWVERVTGSCTGFLCAIPNRTTGDYEILGTRGVPLDIDFNGDGGAKAGDKYGFEFDVKDTSGRMFRTYPKALGLSIAPAVD